MGLKDWFAGNVAGPTGYGQVMGREAVKNGLALGRTLYLGHGVRGAVTERFVFRDDSDLKSNGFEPYCADPLNRPPMEDSTEISRQTRIAGIAFAAQCTITAGSNFMKPHNASGFIRSLGASSNQELVRLNSRITGSDVLEYLELVEPASGTTKVLDMEAPGTSDVLSLFLARASRNCLLQCVVAFQQTGVLGFDLIAIPLAAETVKSVAAAAQKFGW